MKGDLFDKKMRAFEESNDARIHPEMNVIVRIDGRNFSRLTRDILEVEPFDISLRDAMIATTKSIMSDSGFNCIKGFTQSDEISILLNKDLVHKTFGGKIRKFNSLLAAHASVIFSTYIQYLATFDCRVIQLPTQSLVTDYFKWRVADSDNNCLQKWCYWILTTKKDMSPGKAQKELNGKDFAWKNELLFQNGMNYNEVPKWQKQGIFVNWKAYWKPCVDRKTGKETYCERHKLVTDVV